jgi:uncharacterized protein YceK
MRIRTVPVSVMRRELSAWLVTVLAIYGAGGCGTVQNLRGSQAGMPYRQMYGGVAFDAKQGLDLLTDPTCGHAGPPGCVLQKAILAPYLWTVDLALSAVLDTLTLPITVATPTGCPVDLSWKQGFGWYCSFRGAWNTTCGDAKLAVVLKVEAGAVVVSHLYEEGRRVSAPSGDEISTESICVFASASSSRAAQLTGWLPGHSCEGSTVRPLSGKLELSDDGKRLTLVPTEAPFRLNGCDFTAFSGTFEDFQPPAGSAVGPSVLDAFNHRFEADAQTCATMPASSFCQSPGAAHQRIVSAHAALLLCAGAR